MSKIFFDTNILLYAGDSQNPGKQAKAREILTSINTKNSGVISTQILQEYYVIEVKKFKRNPLIVKQILKTWEQFEVITITPSLIEEAIEITTAHGADMQSDSGLLLLSVRDGTDWDRVNQVLTQNPKSTKNAWQKW